MKKGNHLYLIDVLKISALVAISILHTNEFVFYEDVNPLGWKAPIWYMVYHYARAMTLSGQFLVSLIYFLFGFTEKSKLALLKVSLFAFLGQVTLAIIYQGFEWDIYAYIAFTNILIASIPFLFKESFTVLIASFLLLFIPGEFYQNNVSDSPVMVILSGKMTDYNSGSWPVIPWAAFAVIFYQFGLIFKKRLEYFSVLRKPEKFLWPVILLSTIPFLGIYWWVPIGRNFYRYIFNQPPHIFWAHMIIFMFFMRLSVVKSVQEKIHNNRFVLWLSTLYWVRHLGFVYLISIIYLGLGMMLSETFLERPLLFDLYFATFLPVCELVARGIIFVVNKIKKKGP